MKYLTRHRPVTILLCLTLGLLLTACGGQSEPSPAEGSSSLAGALVGGKQERTSWPVRWPTSAIGSRGRPCR